jgi:hypothetical protein
MYSSIRICTFAAAAIVGAGAFAVGLGQDCAEWLSGRYGMSMSLSFIATPRGHPPVLGFDPATRTLLQNGETLLAVLKGVFSFTRQGDVTIENGLLTDLFPNQTNAGDVPISSNTPVSCSGKYSLNGDALAFNLDCTSSLPNDLTVTIGTFQVDGLVGIDKRTITISSTAGNILTENISTAGTVVAQRQRVCILQGTLAKLADAKQPH